MSKALCVAATVAVLLADTAPSSAQTSGPLEPSSNWHLDYGENRCRLARQFGEGSEKHAIMMDMDKPSTYVGLIVTGPSFERVDTSRPIVLQFGDLDTIEESAYSFGDMEPFGPALILHGVGLDAPEAGDEEREKRRPIPREYTESPEGMPSLPFDRFSDVTSLTVERENSDPVAFQLDGLGGALKALNTCTEELITFWGLDLEQHRTMRQGPTMVNYSTFFNGIVSDYPKKASRKGEQGSIRFLVIVGADGEVEECRQSDATALETLESPVCREMRRARFEPALDKDGKPMRSYYASTIRYVLPS